MVHCLLAYYVRCVGLSQWMWEMDRSDHSSNFPASTGTCRRTVGRWLRRKWRGWISSSCTQTARLRRYGPWDGPAHECLPAAQNTRCSTVHCLLKSCLRCVGLSQWMWEMEWGDRPSYFPTSTGTCRRTRALLFMLTCVEGDSLWVQSPIGLCTLLRYNDMSQSKTVPVGTLSNPRRFRFL